MQLSGKATGRLRTGGTHRLLMKESVLVQKGLGERVVMKTVLKATIWPSITQSPASLYKVIFSPVPLFYCCSFLRREHITKYSSLSPS